MKSGPENAQFVVICGMKNDAQDEQGAATESVVIEEEQWSLGTPHRLPSTDFKWLS